jgi:7-cyano-7-deazaguanine synthase
MSLKENEKCAVVLLSGGMDSSTCLAIASQSGYNCHTLAFDYGQRHRRELELAARQARAFEAAEHLVVRVDLACIGGSALTAPMEVPKGESTGFIPVTYVPARNLVFLSIGLALAEVVAAQDLFIGANQVDYSGYPDCRRPFIQAFEGVANLATRMGTQGAGIRVQAPLLDMSKAQIIKKGLELGVDFKNTHTCYDPDDSGRACGRCPACRLRLRGFSEAGVADPISYQNYYY